MDLDELLDKVNSKKTFLEFVSALGRDWEEEEEIEKISPSPPYGPGANGWENGTIGAFLDAMHAWATATTEEWVPEQPSWRAFAQILYAGKYYE